jgi:hypothetical protein
MTQRLKRGDVSRVGPSTGIYILWKYHSNHNATAVELSNSRNDWIDANTDWQRQVAIARDAPGIAKRAPGGWWLRCSRDGDSLESP